MQLLRSVSAALVALALAGCGSPAVTRISPEAAISHPATSSAATGPMIDEVGPPPIVLTNPSPADLALSLHVMMGGYDPTSSSLTELVISLLKGSRPVKILLPEEMVCNGEPVPEGGGAFDLKTLTQAVGGKTVTCIYSLGSTSTTITFTLPPAQAILRPAGNARVARSAQTPISFRVGGQSTMFYVIAIGPDRKAWTYPTPGSTLVTLNTSTFSAGPGTIDLNQEFTLPDLRAPGFHGASGSGDGIQQISVTWA